MKQRKVGIEMNTRKWMRNMLAAILAAGLMITAVTPVMAKTTNVKMNKAAAPVVKLVAAQLIDQHLFYELNGTISAVNGKADGYIAVQWQAGTTQPLKTVKAEFEGKTADGKALYRFRLNVADKRAVDAAGITFQPVRIAANGLTDAKAIVDKAYVVGGSKADIVFGTAKTIFEKTAFDWTENTATGKVKTKTGAGITAVEVFYLTNDTNTWKKVNAEKVATVNGTDEWQVEVNVGANAKTVKWKVAYRTNAGFIFDQMNQAEWKWTR